MPRSRTYSDYRRIWEKQSLRRARLRAMTDAPMHVVRASELIEELQLLSLASGDVRFLAALDALYDKDLVAPSGAWASSPCHPLALIRSELLRFHIFERVEQARVSGVSMRNACACAAAAVGLPANSFDAAVKQAQRVWQTFNAKGHTFNDLKMLEDSLGSTVTPWDNTFEQTLNRQAAYRRPDWTIAITALVQTYVGK